MKGFAINSKGLGLMVAILLATLCLSHPAMAQDQGPWLATQTQGDVWVKLTDGAAMPLQQGDEIGLGSVVGVGASGRATLSRAGTDMTLSPNSETEIPADSDQDSRTTILQRLGTLLLKVDKRPEQHFEVDTPFLAAVVKGTTFTVSVDTEGSAVHVVEGAVEVGAFGSGEVALVRPGQTARVSSQAGSGLKLSGVGVPADKAGGKEQQGQNGAGSAADQETSESLAGSSAESIVETATNGQQGSKESGQQQVSVPAGKAKGLTIEQPIGWTSIDISMVSNGFVAVIPDAAVRGIETAADAGGKPAVATVAGSAVTTGVAAAGNVVAGAASGTAAVGNAVTGAASGVAAAGNVVAGAASGVGAVGNAVFSQAGATVGSVVTGTTAATGTAVSGVASTATGAVAATGGTVSTVVQNTVAEVQNQTQTVNSVVKSLLGGGKN